MRQVKHQAPQPGVSGHQLVDELPVRTADVQHGRHAGGVERGYRAVHRQAGPVGHRVGEKLGLIGVLRPGKVVEEVRPQRPLCLAGALSYRVGEQLPGLPVRMPRTMSMSPAASAVGPLGTSSVIRVVSVIGIE